MRNQTKKGWLTAILELGAWVGTLYSGFLAEIISRKYAILVNTAIFIIGVVVQCTAVTGVGASAILGGRFVTGMGVGSLSMIVPMYNAEVAPPEVRGALVGLQQLAITTGIMISFVSIIQMKKQGQPADESAVDRLWHEPHWRHRLGPTGRSMV